MKLKVALIVDKLKITKWQQDCLDAAKENIELAIFLNCNNTNNKKKYFKNFLYYILNILSLKNHLTQKKKLNIDPKKIINFDSVYENNWQSFPSNVYEILNKQKIDLVVKFGMGLLRINNSKLNIPILSYHHGDPAKYRGRPAGFYEIFNKEKKIGIIVQKLNNQLDAGEILAFANSKVINFSYKKTALNFYSNSKYLLNNAILNLHKKKFINYSVDGKNYRLPSNLQVIRFLYIVLTNAIKKLIYGLFFEKRWKVAITQNRLSFKGEELISSSLLNEVPITKKYNFYADPFFSIDGKKIRFEALDKKTGLGDILEIDSQNFTNQKLIMTGNHFSYPFNFYYKNKEYLMPEVASHSAQYAFNTKEVNKRIIYIKGLEDKNIVDATLFFHEDCYYLFFGEKENSHTVLKLWLSSSPFGIFKPHPMSPIAFSPSDARMGGKLLNLSLGRIIRFGQNNSGEYGESLSVMQILKLSQTKYEEKQIGNIRIDNFKGPHTIDFNKDLSKILIDYYSDKFSLLAGIRRIKARLKNKI